MRLTSFRVQNYRSIADSGEILASQITAILGRNESGKSNLLRALCSLNPPGGRVEYNPIKDFPRSRKLEECKKSTMVIDSTWTLSEAEQEKLTEILPRAKTVTQVGIERRYKSAEVWIGLNDLEDLAYEPNTIKTTLRKIIPSLKILADSLEVDKQANFNSIVDKFATEMFKEKK